MSRLDGDHAMGIAAMVLLAIVFICLFGLFGLGYRSCDLATAARAQCIELGNDPEKCAEGFPR